MNVMAEAGSVSPSISAMNGGVNQMLLLILLPRVNKYSNQQILPAPTFVGGKF
jgi:hypothetical protein